MYMYMQAHACRNHSPVSRALLMASIVPRNAAIPSPIKSCVATTSRRERGRVTFIMLLFHTLNSSMPYNYTLTLLPTIYIYTNIHCTCIHVCAGHVHANSTELHEYACAVAPAVFGKNIIIHTLQSEMTQHVLRPKCIVIKTTGVSFHDLERHIYRRM